MSITYVKGSTGSGGLASNLTYNSTGISFWVDDYVLNSTGVSFKVFDSILSTDAPKNARFIVQPDIRYFLVSNDLRIFKA